MTVQQSNKLAGIPPLPGTYALLLCLTNPVEITVGKLGRSQFLPGFYVYVGSALGPGGLTGRLRRHFQDTTAKGWLPKWHVDYLRHYTKNTGVWAVQSSMRREHDWADLILQLPGAVKAMPGFGSSDCPCPTHLFHFNRLPSADDFQDLLSHRFQGEELIVF